MIRDNAKFPIIFYQDDRAVPTLHRDVVKLREMGHEGLEKNSLTTFGQQTTILSP